MECVKLNAEKTIQRQAHDTLQKGNGSPVQVSLRMLHPEAIESTTQQSQKEIGKKKIEMIKFQKFPNIVFFFLNQLVTQTTNLRCQESQAACTLATSPETADRHFNTYRLKKQTTERENPRTRDVHT